MPIANRGLAGTVNVLMVVLPDRLRDWLVQRERCARQDHDDRGRRARHDDDRTNHNVYNSPRRSDYDHGPRIRATGTRSEVIAAFGPGNVEERTNRFQIDELLVAAEDPNDSDLGILFVLVTGGDTVEFVKTGTLEASGIDEGCV